jgi:hypothetical protein
VADSYEADPSVADPSVADPDPAGERRVADPELEAHLEDALRRARTQLSHIRGNLSLVATFLTRSES